MLSTLLMTALLLGSATNAVAAISGVDVEPASLVAGANGDVVVSFTTGLALGPLTTVTITFPDGFDVSGATKPTDCTGATGPGSPLGEGIKSIGIAGQVITLTYDGDIFDIWEAGAKSCTIGNITNPETAGSTGTYSVATTLESAVTGAADTIVADVVDEIVFTATHGSTDADTTKDFDAQSEDQFGNVRVDTITWSIDSGSGSVDGDGIFTPNQTGTTVVKAAVGAVSNTTSISVSAGALDNIGFTAAPGTTDADTQQTFTAIARDANLNPTGDTIEYTIDSGSGAINGTTGVFTPNQTGTTVIKATSGAVSKTTSIVVSSGAVDSVAFTTAPGTTDADTQQSFVAEARDANLNPTGDTITYSIDSGSGSINATGVFTPDKVGTTVIKAAVGLLSTTSSIVVSAGAADSIAFTSAPSTTDTGTTKTFVAKVYDANLNLVGDAIVYSIDSGSGAINGTTGVFTPNQTGTTVIKAASGLLAVTSSILVSEEVVDNVPSTGGGDSGPKTSYGAKAGAAVQPSPKSQMVHYIEMRKGAVSGMTLTLNTDLSVVVTVNTYVDLPTDLPPGYTPTVVHFDIHVDPPQNLTGAQVDLAPVLAEIFGVPPDELVVLHKVDGVWVEQSTTVTIDGDHVLISFQTDSLSPFSVAHKEPVQAAPEPGPATPVPEEPAAGGPTLGNILLLAGMGVLLALSMVAIVLSRRRKA